MARPAPIAASPRSPRADASRPSPPSAPAGASRHHYLPVDHRARLHEAYLTSVGHHHYPPGARYPKSDHPATYDFDWRRGRVLPEYAVVLITAGRGVFESKATGRVELEAGAALLLPPGVWHRYRPDRDVGWEEWWVCLNGEYLHRRGNKRLLPRDAACVSLDDADPLRGAIERTLHAVERAGGRNHAGLTALALHALFLVAGDAADPSSAEEPGVAEDEIVSRALLYIWHNAHRRITLPTIARAVSVHPRTLERLFRGSDYGTVRRAVTHCRLQRARDLLRTTAMPSKQIAFAVGFSDPRRFNEAFKRATGDTPTAFRNAQRPDPSR